MSRLGFSLTDGRGIVRLDHPTKALALNGYVKVGSRVFHNSEFSLPGQVVSIVRGDKTVVEVRWTNGAQEFHETIELWKDTPTLVHRPGQVPFDRGNK